MGTPQSMKFATPLYPDGFMRESANFLLCRLNFDLLQVHHPFFVEKIYETT
jgi:hypothetical protein